MTHLHTTSCSRPVASATRFGLSACNMKPCATIRTEPSDFIVQELPMYPALGYGDHVFARVRKTNWSTVACIRHLAKILDIPYSQFGHAGMKDRHAITTQIVSFPWLQSRELPSIQQLCGDGIEVLELRRHPHKLRIGHLIGNEFEIVIRGIPSDQLQPTCRTILQLEQEGIVNVFGPQRYGHQLQDRGIQLRDSNVAKTLAWLNGQTKPPRDRRIRALMLSSVQSMLFDRVALFRVENGTIDRVLEGDLCKVSDGGGMFLCTDPTKETERAENGQIIATGPIFGLRMRQPTGKPNQWEQQILLDTLRDVAQVTGGAAQQLVARLGSGSRRALRIIPKHVTACIANRAADRVIVVRMQLPKGCYATTVLGAVMQLRDASHAMKAQAVQNEIE